MNQHRITRTTYETRPGGNTGMRIDLHTHSAVSDGTQTPADLVSEAKSSGLDVVALTDHDTTEGWDEAAQAAHRVGIGLVRGAEISVVHRGISVHLLAYLFDPAHRGLADQMDKVRQARKMRAQRVTALLAKDFPITWDDVIAQAESAQAVGRPHIADALVARGVVASRDEAFSSLLTASSRYYVPHYSIAARQAITLVRAAGGVPVIAHPGAGGRGQILTFEDIAQFVTLGLAGLEVDHRDHDEETRAQLRHWTAQLGIFATGSSDYHGTGKKNRLGENLTPQPVLDQIVAQANGTAMIW